MKRPLALRIEPELLEAVRRCAAEENRSLTNFVETTLKARVGGGQRGWPIRTADGARAPGAAAAGGRKTRQASRPK